MDSLKQLHATRPLVVFNTAESEGLFQAHSDSEGTTSPYHIQGVLQRQMELLYCMYHNQTLLSEKSALG